VRLTDGANSLAVLVLSHSCVAARLPLYRSMASHNDPASSKRRLKIPKALAVALLGSSATLAVSFSGCDAPKAKIAVDAPSTEAADIGFDASQDDALADASIDGSPDAPPDVAIDAPPDARPDAPIDAAIDARPDAAPDARPDAPVA
jgi:hypothetical protein